MWKIIRKGFESFFGNVLYATGEGFCIQFWYDPWSIPTSLKELYPEMFACAVDKEARISDMVVIAPDGGDINWNLLFRCEFQDWEMARLYAFFVHISSKIPKGGDDYMVWQLNCSGVFDVRSFYNSLLEAPSVFLPW